jgi:purine-binding chemotaxis protein CheW
MTTLDRVLLCRAGSRMCALPIVHVEETMRPLPIEPLANMPVSLLGVAIVRGAPIPVIDANLLVASTRKDLGLQRFVTIKVGARRAALLVDAVIGVRTLDSMSTHALPPLFGDAASEGLQAIGALDADLLLVLRSTRIVPESAWSAIDVHLAAP